MSEVIADLRNDIINLMYELQEIVPVLEALDQDVVESSDKESNLYFHETLEYYKKTTEKLRITLEAYFAEEIRAGLPTEISFRRIYKRLTVA